MANPNPKHKFKKGQSGNPGGRAREPQEIKEFKATSYKDFIDGLQRYGEMDKAQLKAECKRQDIRAFDLIFARVVDQATDGEKDARQVLMDRLWGKPKETELSLPHEDLLNRIPIGDLIELARRSKIPNE